MPWPCRNQASRAVQVRPVEGVGNLSDKAPGGSDRQPRIGIQRHHVANAGRQDRSMAIDRHERRVGGAAKQAIELVQLAALALPADPPPLAFIPDAPAMQEKEARAVPRWSVLRVEPRDAGCCLVEKSLVVRGVFGGRIAPVGKQSEDKVGIRVGKVVDLKPLDLLAHGGDTSQHRGYHDDSAQAWRDAIAQFQPGQQRRPHLLRQRAVYHRDGHIRGRNETDDRECQKGPAPCPGMGDGEQRQGQNDRRSDGNRAHVAHHADIRAKPTQPSLQRHAAAKIVLEGTPATGDQVKARVGFGPSVAIPIRGCVACLAGRCDRACGNVGLRVARAPREFLDGAPIEIPGREIHRRKIASGAHDRVDGTDAFEEFRPIDHRDQAHAGYDIARRHVQRALALNFIMDNLVRRRALGCQFVVQPAQRRGRVRVPVAQTLRKLDGELRRPGYLLETGYDCGSGFRRAVAAAEASVGERVDQSTCPQSLADLFGQTAEVLDKCDAERDRKGPELADGQRV